MCSGTRQCDTAVIGVYRPNEHIQHIYTVITHIPGYANEIGESFRPVIPVQYVNLSYAVAIAYVLADCADKTYKKYEVCMRR